MKNAAFAVITAFLLVAAVFYYFKYQEVQKLLKNPREIVKTEVQDLVTRVGKLMVLPNDEQPTVATVQDKKKLKGQSFFAKAENGDKVLIYIKTKRAILYRPSSNKIIEVAPINVGKTTQAAPSTTSGKAGAISPTVSPKVTPSQQASPAPKQ